MEFLDELTEGLDRVLMVRGGGAGSHNILLMGSSKSSLVRERSPFEKLFSPFIRMQSGAF